MYKDAKIIYFLCTIYVNFLYVLAHTTSCIVSANKSNNQPINQSVPHDLLYACFNHFTSKEKSKIIYWRNFDNISKQDCEREASQVPWHNVFNVTSVDKQVDCLNSLIIE